MTAAPDLTGWWTALKERLAETAVAAGATSPGQGPRHWSAGELSKQPVTESTTFYAGSVTKQLIAALVARAVLDGHVDPHASVATFLPELPAWTAPIRVHHLLHHTAALPQPPLLAVALGYPDDPSGWSRLDNEAVLVALHHVTPSPVPPGESSATTTPATSCWPNCSRPCAVKTWRTWPNPSCSGRWAWPAADSGDRHR